MQSTSQPGWHCARRGGTTPPQMVVLWLAHPQARLTHNNPCWSTLRSPRPAEGWVNTTSHCDPGGLVGEGRPLGGSAPAGGARSTPRGCADKPLWRNPRDNPLLTSQHSCAAAADRPPSLPAGTRGRCPLLTPWQDWKPGCLCQREEKPSGVSRDSSCLPHGLGTTWHHTYS